MNTPIRHQILLVEDEMHIAQGLIFNLERENFQVTHCTSGEEALRLFNEQNFDLIILDLMLPGISGFEVCRQIRIDAPRLPVLMLTAMTGQDQLLKGLSEGADDYMTKPFNLAEFLLRVRGMLKRSRWYAERTTEQVLHFGTNEIDLERRQARTARGELQLTELEVKILRTFFDRSGEAISRAELLSSVWGMSPETETRTLDNFIVRLRKYFEDDPAKPVHFITVRGQGYRFQP